MGDVHQLNPKRVNLEDWIQMALNDQDYDKPCSAIALQHLTLSGSETEVKTVKVGGGRDWTTKDLGNFMMDLARGYAQNLTGVQNFRLLAFYGTNEARSRHPFILAGQIDNNGLGSEPPTAEGRLMQRMRHEEALVQGMMQERLALLEMPIRQFRMMMEYQEKLMSELHEVKRENLDAITIVKEVIMEKAANQADKTMAAKRFERETKEREMFMRFGGVAINELTGKEIVPQGTADTMLVEALADGLDADSVQKIMDLGVIKPELMGILMSRLTKVLERRRKLEEEALERGSETERDAADDPVLEKHPPENANGNGNAH